MWIDVFHGVLRQKELAYLQVRSLFEYIRTKEHLLQSPHQVSHRTELICADKEIHEYNKLFDSHLG